MLGHQQQLGLLALYTVNLHTEQGGNTYEVMTVFGPMQYIAMKRAKPRKTSNQSFKGFRGTCISCVIVNFRRGLATNKI